MPEALLRIDNLIKRFGQITATDNLCLNVASGELHAIIGPNGAGKTTLLAQLSGELAPSSGRILFDGMDISALDLPDRVDAGIARSFQITSLCNEFTAAQNVALALQSASGHAFRFWRNAWKDDVIMNAARDGLYAAGLSGAADLLVERLSHGERRQLELAVAIATRPRLLMLDEPLAGMAREDAESMIRLIGSLKKQYTILFIEHDMDAVFSLADRVSVLVYGRCIATGTPEEIQNDKVVREAYLGGESVHAAH